MKKIMVIGLLALSACGGTLSDEQRKKIREDMALHEIKKVTEVEITEAALERGRSIMKSLEKIRDNSEAIRVYNSGWLVVCSVVIICQLLSARLHPPQTAAVPG